MPTEKRSQLEMKIANRADRYAAIMAMGGAIVIWGGVLFVLVKAMFYLL